MGGNRGWAIVLLIHVQASGRGVCVCGGAGLRKGLCVPGRALCCGGQEEQQECFALRSAGTQLGHYLTHTQTFLELHTYELCVRACL